MKKLSPYSVIVLSFASIVIIGTVLLLLPISKESDQSLVFIDAFFLASSAVTITGLSPILDVSIVLSPFGKIVLALLIQIGGLSILTLSIFIMYIIGAKIGISNRVIIKESFNQNTLSGMVKLVIRIIKFTFIIEFIGFIVNILVFMNIYDGWKLIGVSAFHAISSFNNAGFDIIGSNNLQDFNHNNLLNINTALLIMLGGLGFIVINDIYEKKSYKKLMIHSKIVLKTNLFLWSVGTLIFKFLETKTNSLSFIEAFFLSVTARTAGFSTINIASISSLTTLILIVLMFIGASPGSTGGGIKTTTAYTLFKQMFSFASGKQVVTHERLIGNESRNKATILLTTVLTIIVISTAILLLFENIELDRAFFEIVSAFSNVGLSKNLTPTLSGGSKILISIVMLIGRVGPLTVLSLFNANWHKKELHNIEYIEEKIMIG